MATILKRNSRFLVRVRVSGSPTINKTFNDRRSAQAWASHAEDAVRRGVYDFGRQDMPTLREALSSYLKKITPKKRGSRQETHVVHFLQALQVATKPLDQIYSAEFARLRDVWAKEVSASTIQKRHALLSHLYNTAAREWGYTVENPLLRVSKLKVVNQRCRTVAPAELDAIINSAPSSTIKAIARLGFLTAARLGELTALQWQDIDLTGHVMTFQLTKNGTSRTIPLVPSAIALLESLQPQSKTQQRPSGPVFGVTSQSMSKAWAGAVHKARRTYEKACHDQGRQPDAAWLVDAHFHDLRHSAITRLAEEGLSTLELASISGHKSLQMLARYVHVNPENLAQKLARLEQAGLASAALQGADASTSFQTAFLTAEQAA